MIPFNSVHRLGSPLMAMTLAFTMTFSTTSHAQTLNTDWWYGAQVHSMVPSLDGSVIYMGGDFRYVGPPIHYAALLDTGTGQAQTGTALPNNTVYCSFPDDNGGWYIGGLFTHVGGQPREGVAHINADGSLSDLQVAADGSVYSLLLDGSTLYIGGSFDTIAGQPRAGLAAVEASTGALLPFAPTLGGSLFPAANTMVVIGDNLVFGGDFTTVNGASQTNLAAVNKQTGVMTSWSPDPNYEVHAMCFSEDGSVLYVGGRFTSIALAQRTRTAAFNTTTMALLPWTVAADDAVECMSLEQDKVALGGEFETLGGQPREHLGVVDASTGAVLPFTADADQDVVAVVLHDDVVHVGGGFDEIGGVQRRYIAAIDVNTSEVTDWNPIANSNVYTLSRNGEKWLAGGWFTSIGGKIRRKLMAMDVATGMPTDWDPQASYDWGGGVSQLRLSPDGQVLYCGGAFNDTIGGQHRKFLMALDANTAQVLPWAPQPDGYVSDIELSPDGSVIYVAGAFSNIAGGQRRKLAALSTNAQQTQLLPWNPDCTFGTVGSMELTADGSTLFVGGNFTSAQGTIGGQPRDRLAALSTTMDSNNATSWIAPLAGPNAIGTSGVSVQTVLLDHTTNVLYVGGLFNEAAGHTVSGAPRDNLAAVSATTGAVLPWDPGANDRVTELKWSREGQLMVCGRFQGPGAIGGADRQGFAYVDPVSGAVGPFSPEFNYLGYGVDVEDFEDLLILSGYFASVNGEVRLSLAAFQLEPTSIGEAITSSSLTVFPNPVTDEVWLPSLPAARSVTLLDATGRTALQTSYQRTLRLDGLSSGAYILIVRDMDQREIGRSKVILER